MKVYIQTDIEGVAGFCFQENRANPGIESVQHRYRMYKLLTDEVNAAVKAAFDEGADEVYVNDNHGRGYNILFEDLDERCQIIHGRNGSGEQWMAFLDETVDCMLQIGMHAMGATPCSIIPHSRWEVNDGEFYLSEGTMAAAVAGDLGVPSVMMSGDDKICAEFREKIPDIEQVQTKIALSCYQACSLIPARACKLIYEAARRGIARRHEIKPFVVKGPVRLRLWDNATHVPPLSPLGETIERPTITQAEKDYYPANKKSLPWYNGPSTNLDGFMFP
jgi:D-amino peptidase